MKTSAQTIRLTAAAAAIGLTLAGCSAPDDVAQEPDTDGTEAAGAASTHESGESDHEGMDHPSDGGAPPEGIEKAADPKFDVGDAVVLSADHMPGMKGAEATRCIRSISPRIPTTSAHRCSWWPRRSHSRIRRRDVRADSRHS